MRAALVVIIIATVLPGGTTLAQRDEVPWDTILVHPNVTTVLRLPEEIERVRFTGQVAGLIKATTLGNEVLLQPHRGVPAWDEVSLQVQTATLRLRLRLRLARRARDAWRYVPVVPVEQRATGSSVPEACDAGAGERVRTAQEPAARAPASTPALAAPSAPAPAKPPAPAPAKPSASVAVEPENTAAVDDGRDVPATGSPPFEISVHAVATLVGATELAVAGYEAGIARQFQRAFGVRLTGAPPGRWWAVEANVSGEWLAGSTVHGRDNAGETQREAIEVSGPLLRADVGMRVRVGTPWSLTAYAGPGLLVHHRNIEPTAEDPFGDPAPQDDESTRDMPFIGVLALGLGIQYQAKNVLLGLDFQVRQGVPEDYRSVAAVLSVGCFLNQRE